MGTKPNWKALNVQMEPELYAAVKSAANTSERTVSAWVRLACRKMLASIDNAGALSIAAVESALGNGDALDE